MEMLRYREFVTHGSGNTRNSSELCCGFKCWWIKRNIRPVKSKVSERWTIGGFNTPRSFGSLTKFNTKLQLTTSNCWSNVPGNGLVKKSCWTMSG